MPMSMGSSSLLSLRAGLWSFLFVGVLLFNELTSGVYLNYLSGVAPGGFWGGGPRYDDPAAEDYVVILCMCRNATYLREWIEHHRSIGVDRIVIYDDSPGSGPESVPSNSAVKQYTDTGFVELHDAHDWDNKRFFMSSELALDNTHTARVGGLGRAFLFDKLQKMEIDTWKRLRRENHPKNSHMWLGLVDDDEYYNPKTEPLKATLKRARLNGALSLRVVKFDFGTSGHSSPPEGGVRANYVMRDPSGKKHTGLAIVSAITGMAPGCVHVYATNSFLADLSRGSHECNDWHGKKYAGKVRYGVYYSPKDELVINHYLTKSYAECRQRECVKHPDGQYVGRHCLEPKHVCDDSILRHHFDDGMNTQLGVVVKESTTVCGNETRLEEVHRRTEELYRKNFPDSHHFSLFWGTWHYFPACSDINHNWEVCRKLNSSGVIVCNDKKNGAEVLWVDMDRFDACVKCIEAKRFTSASDGMNPKTEECESLVSSNETRKWNGEEWNDCRIVQRQIELAEYNVRMGRIYGIKVAVEG